jgi:cytochrome P450 RapN
MTMNSELVSYPMFEVKGLEVDERYKDIQKRGLLRIKLPFGEPCWLATRYADTRTVWDYKIFSRALGLAHDAPGMFPSERIKDPKLMINMDPPEHSRIRTLAAASFTPARIQQFEGWILSMVNELLDEMVAAGQPADFIAIYSLNLSLRVLTRILGIPAAEAAKFRKYVDFSSKLGIDEKERVAASTHTMEFVRQLIAGRRSHSSDDLLGELVHARDHDDRLGEEELVALALSLWNGGFKTTSWQLGTTVYTLMANPEHWRELLEKPELLPAALTELWRWIPSFKYGVPFVRWAKQDVKFSDGTVVRAGDAVLPEFAVANRDESVFPDGWKLDFHRDKTQPHLSFTVGAHACLGQHLARLQVRLTVETLLRRFPTLALAVAPNEIKWDKASFMRGVESLPLRW